MTQRPKETPLGWERPHARHAVAGSLAVVLSLLLHAFTIQRAPPVPIGRVPAVEGMDRLPPVVLGEVRRTWTTPLDEPAGFRPTDPSVAPRVVPDPASFRRLIEALLPEAPADMGVTLAGEDRAVRPPEPEPERAPWEPRQDILRIKDRTVPDEISALPRKLIPDIPYAPSAPDIAPPVEEPGMRLVARGEQWRQAAAGASAPRAPEGLPPWVAVDAVPERPDQVTDVTGIEDLLALHVEAYRPPGDEEGVYFRIAITRSGAEALPVLPRDILLIQDASASMTQAKVDKAKQGLHAWLTRLNEGDRLDVIAFRDDVERAFGDFRPWSPIARTEAAFFIETMRARGGTDVFASLQPLMAVDATPERPLIAIMITDGVPTVGLVDTTEIIARFSEANAGHVSVFCVGGGPRVNMYLLDFLSYKNRGDASLPLQSADLPVALADLADALSRPVLTHLNWRLAGTADVDLFPLRPTHLYLDRPLQLYGRAPADTSSVILRLAGRSKDQVKDMVFRLDLEQAAPGGMAIRTGWAWQKIYHLVSEHIRTGDGALLSEIRRMSAAYDIPLHYGALRVPDAVDRRVYFHGGRAGQDEKD